MNLRATISTASLVFASTLASVTIAPLALAESASDWPVPANRAARINPVPSTFHSKEIGQKIYTDGCNGCHGPDPGFAASGSDLSSEAVLQQTDGALFWKIKHGRNDMPGFRGQLRNRQIWHVINYMRSQEFQD